jgi:hypothetical protein
MIEAPVQMVVAGGIAQAMMLPIIALGTLYLRHRHLPRIIEPSRWVTYGLWIASAIIVGFIGYFVYDKIRGAL